MLRIWAIVADHDEQNEAIRGTSEAIQAEKDIAESHRKGLTCNERARRHVRLVSVPGGHKDPDGVAITLPRREVKGQVGPGRYCSPRHLVLRFTTLVS